MVFVVFFILACVKPLLQIRISGALAYFPNHRGANNQLELRICLALFQTWMLVKHPCLQVLGFTERLSECLPFLVANREDFETSTATWSIIRGGSRGTELRG